MEIIKKLEKSISEKLLMLDSIIYLMEENILDDEFFEIFLEVATEYSREIKILTREL